MVMNGSGLMCGVREIAAAAIVLGLAGAAQAEVEAVRFGGDGAVTRIVVDVDAPARVDAFALPGGSAPRVVLDLANHQPSPATPRLASGARIVEGYRWSPLGAEGARMVFDLGAPGAIEAAFTLGPAGPGLPHRVVVDVRAEPNLVAARSARRLRPERPEAPNLDGPKRVVVIDAGHGGRDPGAIGPTFGTYEKDVTLAAALDLRNALETRGGYEVVLTREADVYVEHLDRVDIARRRGADLFISLHADAIARSDVRGASVYTLAERAEGRAKTEILGDEPWLVDVDLPAAEPQVGDILVNLAQRETKNQSAAFAERLIPELAQVAPLLRNTHRNANLFVLLAPDVPAVLLEMGFLTHPTDETNLRDPRFRLGLVEAVADGIDGYFAESERRFASR